MTVLESSSFCASQTATMLVAAQSAVYRDPPHYSSFVPSTARPSIAPPPWTKSSMLSMRSPVLSRLTELREADEAWRCLLAAQVDQFEAARFRAAEAARLKAVVHVFGQRGG
jgi:hypothetical protein